MKKVFLPFYFFTERKYFFFFYFLFVEHIDNWYNLTSKFSVVSRGQIHLILDYQPLKF